MGGFAAMRCDYSVNHPLGVAGRFVTRGVETTHQQPPTTHHPLLLRLDSKQQGIPWHQVVAAAHWAHGGAVAKLGFAPLINPIKTRAA